MEKLQCHTSQDSVTKSGGLTVAAEWRNGIIIPLPKKGDLSECGN